MKQEVEEENLIEIEAPKFEEPGNIEALFLGEASTSMTSEIAPSEKPPTKTYQQLFDYRRKYDDSFITESVNMNCDVCDKELKSFEDALKHYKEIHNQEGYLTCCSRKFKKRHVLIDHIEHHKGKHKCKFCLKFLSSASNLKKHIDLTHLPQSRFQCNVCSTYFKNYHQLSSHIKTDHAQPKSDKNSAQTTPKSSLPKKTRKRTKVPNDQKSVICEICGKASKDKWILKAHIRLCHSDPKERSQCTICGHYLKNAQLLRKHHNRKHKVDEKGFTCEFCDKQCDNKGSLISHRLRHHLLPDKFACSFSGCDKKFKKKIDLTEHEAGHRGIDLYNCQFCSAGFKKKCVLSGHLKAKHPEHYDKVKPYWLKSNEELLK